MQSLASRVLAFMLRIISPLFCRSFWPIAYQRLWLSVAGRIAWPVKGVRFEALTVGAASRAAKPLRCEWIVPEGADDDRVILYLHGGAFVVGSIVSHRRMAARIAKAARSRALIIDYRLAPENPYPAALDDSVAAYEWLLSRGYRSDRIVIAGDSAGGGLTASTLVRLRDSGTPLPAAAAMLSPATDLAMTGDSFRTKAREDPLIDRAWGEKCINMYLAGTDPRDPVASPTYADLQGLPPMLIQVGTREVLLDDSRRFAEAAKAAGVDVELQVWQGMFHVWQAYAPLVPESCVAIEKIGSYCESKTAVK